MNNTNGIIGYGSMVSRQTFGKFVATEPIKDTGIKSEKKSGVAFLAQKTSLVRLQVIFGNNSVTSGNFIYVTGDSFKQPWANKIFSLDGADFILVPEEHIQLVELPLPYIPPATITVTSGPDGIRTGATRCWAR